MRVLCNRIILSLWASDAWPQVSAKAFLVCGSLAKSQLGSAAVSCSCSSCPGAVSLGHSLPGLDRMKKNIGSIPYTHMSGHHISGGMEGMEESMERVISIIAKHSMSDLVHPLSTTSICRASSCHPFSAFPTAGDHPEGHPAQSGVPCGMQNRPEHEFE